MGYCAKGLPDNNKLTTHGSYCTSTIQQKCLGHIHHPCRLIIYSINIHFILIYSIITWRPATLFVFAFHPSRGRAPSSSKFFPRSHAQKTDAANQSNETEVMNAKQKASSQCSKIDAENRPSAANRSSEPTQTHRPPIEPPTTTFD